MVNRRWIVLVVLMGALGVGTYLFLRPTEEKRIRRQFEELVQRGRKEGTENMLTAAGKARGVAALMTDSVTIAGTPFGMDGTYERDHLAAVIIQGRMRFDSLQPEIHDLDVALEGEASATARFTAQLKGKVMGEPVNEVREVHCGLTKEEGEWLISRIEAVDVLRK